MSNKVRLFIIGVLLVVFSGCFPIFVPIRERGGGRHEEHGGERY